MSRDLRERDGLHPADQKFLSNVETHGWVVTKASDLRVRPGRSSPIPPAYFTDINMPKS